MPHEQSPTCTRPHLPSPHRTTSSYFSTTEATTNPPALCSTFEPADLDLMHRYSTSTYLSLAGHDPDTQEAWQIQVPMLASSHSYLMHSLLALAALHRNALLMADEPGHSRLSSLRHYNHAIRCSKAALNSVTADNCISLFVFSGVITIVAFASPLHSPDYPFDDPFAELLQISTLVRGSKSIIQHEIERVRAGSLAALIPSDFLAHVCDLPSDIGTALALVQRHVDAYSDEENAAKATYNDTIKSLELCFRNTVSDPENPMVVMSWLAMVADEYLSLLHARAFLTLACLAHFAVLLHGLHELWWCGDWGKRLMVYIERESCGELQCLLEWPKKKIGLGPIAPRL